MIETNDFEAAKIKYETSKNLRWKYYWWNVAEEIYFACKDWAKKYLLDPVNRTIKKIINTIGKIYDSCEYVCPPFNNDNGVEKFYLIELLDENGDIIWSKIGTTSRPIQKRMHEHLYSTPIYAAAGVRKIRVLRVYNPNTLAVKMEMYFRSFYYLKYPDKFVFSDRFLGRIFDLEKADEIAAKVFV